MNQKSAEFKRLYIASGWKQIRVAKELDLNPSSVSLAISGKYEPSLSILRLFAGLIGERVLLPGEDADRSFIRDGPRWLEDWEEAIILALRRIDPKVRKRVVTCLEEIFRALTRPATYSKPKPVPDTHDIAVAINGDIIAGKEQPTHDADVGPSAEFPPLTGLQSQPSKRRKTAQKKSAGTGGIFSSPPGTDLDS